MSACQCRVKVNEKLKPFNTQITAVYSISAGGLGMPLPISTSQIETGRGKAKAMGLYASFCPFCGVSLKDPAAGQEASP